MVLSLPLTVEYIKHRQLEDGGFFFAREAGTSNVEDTFFSIAILTALGEEIPRRDDVISYLRGAQKEDGSFASVDVARYVVDGLSMLGEEFEVSEGFKSWILSFSKHDFWLESGSELAIQAFEAATDLLASANLLSRLDLKKLRAKLAYFESEEGGYGIRVPTLANTYYAVRAMRNLGLEPNGGVEAFLEACEVRGRGFSERPNTYPPVITDMFHGLWLSRVLNHRLSDPAAVEEFVLSYMNGNGGFRFFPEMGISTIENTYYAVGALSLLEGQNSWVFEGKLPVLSRGRG